MSDAGDLVKLPPRAPSGHKGTFGTVVVLGGCATGPAGGPVMIGAPGLAARAALRSGAGLAKLIVPSPIAIAAVTLCPSATAIGLPVDGSGAIVPYEAARVFDEALESAACVVIGPGMGGGAEVQPIALRAASQAERPVVIDADALNALAAIPELTKDFRAAAVLTPHPGEFRTLAASLGLREDAVDPAKRPRAAEALAQRLGAVVVLKGHRTVVSNGHQTWVNESGGPELATGGTGDVLAGLIGGLIAQAGAAMSLFDVARLAVHVHGLAGERWRTRRGASAGLLASELADGLPEALEAWRG